jgi:LacI family transcriptional regulator
LVSLKDISARCGVSVATVSKALNDHKDVSQATKQKLLQVAKEMGYFPNLQARALKTNRTYNLGVMFLDAAESGLTHEFFAKVLNSFKTEAEESGYDITFINRNLGSRHMTTYEHCKYRNVDGVIIACTDFTAPDVYEVINGDIPVVTIDHIFDCRTAIMSDNFAGMSALVDYVCKKGHKRLAYIQGNKSSVAEKRIAGFYKECKNHGIEVNQEHVVVGDFHNPDITYKLTTEILKTNTPPTCIFMPDDYSAIGGYNAIRDLGLTVGKDISVVGYDGIAYSQFFSPRLTTYKQDTDEIGRVAAKQLIQLIEKPQTTFNEVLSVSGELIEGDSVGSLI